ASAGRTRWCAAVRCGAAEHPRVGGEDGMSDYPEIAARGTPPRRRGGPQLEGRLDRGVRNTPASAGRTSAICRSRPRTTEHPRVGGEDHGTPTAHISNGGTPPRRRGGL